LKKENNESWDGMIFVAPNLKIRADHITEEFKNECRVLAEKDILNLVPSFPFRSIQNSEFLIPYFADEL